MLADRPEKLVALGLGGYARDRMSDVSDVSGGGVSSDDVSLSGGGGSTTSTSVPQSGSVSSRLPALQTETSLSGQVNVGSGSSAGASLSGVGGGSRLLSYRAFGQHPIATDDDLVFLKNWQSGFLRLGRR